MPIYEYQCGACEHHLEKLQKMSEDKLVDCPECGKPTLKRLVSAAAFRLKGSGWYETDFKKDNKRNLADGSSSDKPAKKASKETGKTTDKPAASASDKKPVKQPAAKSATKD